MRSASKLVRSTKAGALYGVFGPTQLDTDVFLTPANLTSCDLPLLRIAIKIMAFPYEEYAKVHSGEFFVSFLAIHRLLFLTTVTNEVHCP